MNIQSMEDELIHANLEKPIYRKIHLLLATFFGGPLAIVYILAENFKQFGEAGRVRKTWIIGIGLCLLFFIGVAYMASSKRIPNLIIPLISILTGTAIMQSWQGSDIQLHSDAGGRIHPLTRALLVGILSLVATILFFVIIAFIYAIIFGIPPKQ
jgi:hypothetical protein